MNEKATFIKVDAETKSVRELLDGAKYQIDYYQREYRWEEKHVKQLLDDLETRFDEAYTEGHARTEVRNYPHYFLGPVIVSHKNGQNFLIDGQQRLTTLTLLLIYLYRLQLEQGVTADKLSDVQNLVFSTKYGARSFNIDVDERQPVMDALYRGTEFAPTTNNETVQNLWDRYDVIEREFPQIFEETLNGGGLFHFIDWLKENVDLVKITAYSDEEAYLIFETMNDRGLRLTSTEMLKGYLLANIRDDDERNAAHAVWRKRVGELIDINKDEELDFFKNWLRAKYAQKIRVRQKGAANEDFDDIGTTFHRWVRDNEKRVDLGHSDDFRDFICAKFNKFADYYVRLLKAAGEVTPGLEAVYYNNYVGFTLQYLLELAPLGVEDDVATATRKMRLVANFIDLYVVHRVVNYKTLRYSSIVYKVFTVMKEIRDLDVAVLAETLKAEVASWPETFDAVAGFALHSQNRRYIQYLLARITSYIEREAGLDDNFVRYIAYPVQVEHIWSSDAFGQYAEDFENDDEFQKQRQYFGGLLLLPANFNQSYGAAPYNEKLEHYFGQNLLVKSLHPRCYERNPGFTKFVAESGLPFKPHDEFRLADFRERQELYRCLCEEVWNPDRLLDANA
jgi:uncharacterized protein with ParB-like and HNH nuclease domain